MTKHNWLELNSCCVTETVERISKVVKIIKYTISCVRSITLMIYQAPCHKTCIIRQKVVTYFVYIHISTNE